MIEDDPLKYLLDFLCKVVAYPGDKFNLSILVK